MTTEQAIDYLTKHAEKKANRDNLRHETQPNGDIFTYRGDVYIGKMPKDTDTQLTEETEEWKKQPIEIVRAFHNNALGVISNERWNGLRILEKDAWAKYCYNMRDRELDISQLRVSEPCACKGNWDKHNVNCENRDWGMGSHDKHWDGESYPSKENPRSLKSNPIQLTEEPVTMHPSEYPMKVREDGKVVTNVANFTRRQFLDELDTVTRELFTLLSEKNLKYGDSALNPSCTFARGDCIELINVRMDDKLARIKNASGNDDEDPEWDLMGYLALKRIAVRRKQSLLKPKHIEPTEKEIENEAIKIYWSESFYPSESRPEWVMYGNSDRQEECRKLAITKLKTQLTENKNC